jgi:hypothetical protein
MTVDCPLDCEHLREARVHERLPDVNPDEFPNQDIRVTEPFLRDNENLLVWLSAAFTQAGLSTPGAIDQDIREALESLVRTYRTLESGLYYETRPANPIAAAIQQSVQDRVQKVRDELRESRGMETVRDADVLGVLVFLQRLEIQHNNARRRGRAFLDFLRSYFPFGSTEPGQPAEPRLIVP